jgi:hypothetical protein
MKIKKYFKKYFKKNNIKKQISNHKEIMFRFDSDHGINKICYSCKGRQNAISVTKRQHKYTRNIGNNINTLKSPEQSTLLIKRNQK